jgi:hypothetical protein
MRILTIGIHSNISSPTRRDESDAEIAENSHLWMDINDSDEVSGKGKRGTSAAFPDHSRSPCYTTVDFPPLFNAINGGVRE